MFEWRKIICLTCTCWTHSYEKQLHGYYPNIFISAMSHFGMTYQSNYRFVLSIFLPRYISPWLKFGLAIAKSQNRTYCPTCLSGAEEALIWLVAYVHEIANHEQMQADGIRPIRASLLGLAGSMQDKGGPTCQSHRLDRLHPLMQATKQHLIFFCIRPCNLPK